MWVYDHEISYGLCYMVKQTDYIYKYAILTVIQCYELLFMIMNYNELYIYIILANITGGGAQPCGDLT